MSTHITWSSKCPRNVQEACTYSLGHKGEAVESTSVMDIPGVFISKDGTLGLKAVLHKCSYNKEHDFNLFRILRLFHNQGWKITQGDKSLIRIENGKFGVINSDIVVPTANGAIYACKFMQWSLHVLIWVCE